MSNQTTLRQLRETIAAEEAELQKLKERREQLSAQLDDLTATVIALSGETSDASAAPGPEVTPAPKKTTAQTTAPSMTSEMTLRDAVHAVLAQADGPMRAGEIAENVASSGYRSKSKDLRKQIGTLLSQDKAFRKVSRGLYRVRGAAS